jgi:hypothetical protein
MGKDAIWIAGIIVLALNGTAAAASFTAEVADQNGRPVANAVVSLVPDAKAPMPPASSRLPGEKIIDQRNETFIPLVTILPKGGHIIFTNNDQTTHQVYSFSAVKQFELTLNRGQVSPPVVFDLVGVAALGCNIHDHMIAYAYVAESPWTALTGADGRAVIDVPDGTYTATLWHPQLPPGRAAPSLQAVIAGDTAKASFTLDLPASPMAHMAHAHGGNY